MSPEGQEDRDYWNDKYAEALVCINCGELLDWDDETGDYFCPFERDADYGEVTSG